jgi:YVTN family beta-propeller protein
MAILRRFGARVLLPLVLASAGVLAGGPAPAAEPPPLPGGFTAVTPARILDTRSGLGAPAAKVGPDGTIELQVAGRGGVPATGVAAVAVNLTVTEPTSTGFVTASPAGEARPLASNTNFAAGQTVATAAVVKLGAGGRIALVNSHGSSHLVVDVTGWHASARATGSSYTPVTPTRVLDTRTSQPLGPGGVVAVPITQAPPGVTAVALNITGTQPTADTYLTAYPAAEAQPPTSSLNLLPGQTRANFVAVKVSNNAVKIYNLSGSTHVVVDLLGYWAPFSSGRMQAMSPTRVLDTRTGLGAAMAPLGKESTAVLQFPGPSSVQVDKATAVVLTVTVTQPAADGWLVVYPGDAGLPLASNLNYTAGATVPNLVVVPLDELGRVRIYSSEGPVDVIVDVVGWFDRAVDTLALTGLSTSGSEVVVDPTSTYAFISNTAQNQVEVLRLADGVFEAPILVGSQPMGLDLTPAGDRLYVALRGSSFVSVVDVAARTELRRIPISSDFMADAPYSIAVLANGKALLSTTFHGSGFGGRMLQIDLATDVATQRTDFWHWGTNTEFTSLRSSADHQSAVITAGGISSGPVFRYDAPTDTFSNEVDTSSFTTAISTNASGTVTLLAGGKVFDREMRLIGTVSGCGSNGVAVNAAGTVGYGLTEGGVQACDLVRFQVTRFFPVPSPAVGRLAVSPDGRFLVGIASDGVVLVRP